MTSAESNHCELLLATRKVQRSHFPSQRSVFGTAFGQSTPETNSFMPARYQETTSYGSDAQSTSYDLSEQQPRVHARSTTVLLAALDNSTRIHGKVPVDRRVGGISLIFAFGTVAPHDRGPVDWRL